MNNKSSSSDDDEEAPIIVFLIGGPGSGKTTQARALAGEEDDKSVRVSPGVVRTVSHLFTYPTSGGLLKFCEN